MTKPSENKCRSTTELIPGTQSSGKLFGDEFAGADEAVITFENDEARRKHFLSQLRTRLEGLYAKLGDVPFTTVEDAVKKESRLVMANGRR